RFDPGGRVSGDAADHVDDVLELLLLVGLEKPRPLEGPELHPDPGRLQVVERRLAGPDRRDVGPQISGLEALRVSGLEEQLLRFRRVELKDRWLPVEVEGGRDDAPGALREPEALGLVDRLTVD